MTLKEMVDLAMEVLQQAMRSDLITPYVVIGYIQARWGIEASYKDVNDTLGRISYDFCPINE